MQQTAHAWHSFKVYASTSSFDLCTHSCQLLVFSGVDARLRPSMALCWHDFSVAATRSHPTRRAIHSCAQLCLEDVSVSRTLALLARGRRASNPELRRGVVRGNLDLRRRGGNYAAAAGGASVISTSSFTGAGAGASAAGASSAAGAGAGGGASAAFFAASFSAAAFSAASTAAWAS